MKIKSLWVSKYKNVEDINLSFDFNLITLLVGKNGLGKSNLIEILTLIFEVLNEVNDEKDLVKWASDNFEFEINFQTVINEIKLSLRNQAKKDALQEDILFRCEYRPINSDRANSYSKIELKQVKKALPKHIIGYYSGENKRISSIIGKSEEAIKKNQKANKFDEEFRYLFFTQNHHSQLLLLTLLIWQKEPFLEKFSLLMGQYLNIDEMSGVEISFNSPFWDFGPKAGNEYANTGVNHLFENYDSGKEFPFWGVKGKANKLLQFFYDSGEGLPAIDDKSDNKQNKDSREEIIFNNIVLSSLNKNLDKYFQHPIELFDALEACLDIDILKEITLRIRKRGIQDLIVFNELSEGEQQLLTVMCLILIMGKDDCLFLLDEPDTHLNPDWQRDYVNLLTNFNLNEENSHIFVATHSPLIVQAAEKCDLVLFYRNENGQIKVDENELNIHNWRIDQVLTSKYFNLKSARPAFLDDYMEERNRIISKSEITTEDEKRLKELQDQYGVLPTGESIIDLKLFQFINKLGNKLGDK
jgi:energy-coupling factor transporter ATP-binding protein EcfA2